MKCRFETAGNKPKEPADFRVKIDAHGVRTFLGTVVLYASIKKSELMSTGYQPHEAIIPPVAFESAELRARASTMAVPADYCNLKSYLWRRQTTGWEISVKHREKDTLLRSAGVAPLLPCRQLVRRLEEDQRGPRQFILGCKFARLHERLFVLGLHEALDISEKKWGSWSSPCNI